MQKNFIIHSVKRERKVKGVEEFRYFSNPGNLLDREYSKRSRFDQRVIMS